MVSTVDGRNLANQLRLVVSPSIHRFFTSQEVVWDFFHQQYPKQRVDGPLPNGLYKWLINGVDPNHVSVRPGIILQVAGGPRFNWVLTKLKTICFSQTKGTYAFSPPKKRRNVDPKLGTMLKGNVIFQLSRFEYVSFQGGDLN